MIGIMRRLSNPPGSFFMKRFLLCACVALTVGACASEPTSSTDQPAEQKVYRTGSNIPSRQPEGVVTMSPEEMERQRQQSVGNLGRGKGS